MNKDDGAYYRRLYRLWAAAAFGPASKTLCELNENFDDPESLFSAVREDGELRSRMSPEALRSVDGVSLSAAESIMELCEKKNMKIVTIDEEEYPSLLRHIYNPPALLFYKGDISGLNEKLNIGIVGTRKPSQYSRKTAAAIVHTLSSHGFEIVSGFAEGIDICAHLECLKSGGRTYAVIGSGIDYPYPRANLNYASLIEENGAFISEFLPGTQPYPGNFLLRNRILAGISMGVAVIEAGAQSGSLNSAGHAINQGKPVFAVPPCDIFDTRYKGNASLLRDGAIPLMGARDIYGEYCINSPHIIIENERTAERLEIIRKISEESERAEIEKEISDKVKAKSAKKSAAKAVQEKAENTEKEAPLSPVQKKLGEAELAQFTDPVQNKIVRQLSEKGKLRADELSALLDTEIDQILSALTELEIMGNVQSAGGSYSLS